MTTSRIGDARRAFHQMLVGDHTLSVNKDGVASNADSSQATSRKIAAHIAGRLQAQEIAKKLDGQRAGKQFEGAVQAYLAATVELFPMLRPGKWHIENVGGSRAEYQIARYEPYRHLDDLAQAIKTNTLLASVLGNSYEISPDILVIRDPEPDAAINADEPLVDDETAQYTIIRQANNEHGIIHAVVSCKWTLRSDRAQNARSEALNIIRNRKGRTPHIVVVTAEPTPSRLASLAMGTGDMDTIYHFALPELTEAVQKTGNDEASDLLKILINGKRLRDISDLPLDLTV